MSNKEEFDKFDSLMRLLWSIFLCFGMFVNLAFVYTIWTKKSLHRPLFFFMASFAICDAVGSFCAIYFWTLVRFFPFSLHSCKSVYFLKSIPRNFKPILMSIVFVVLLTRPDISRRSSFIIIAALSIVSVVCALPEGLDSELKTYGSNMICISSLTHHPFMTCMSLLMKIAMPATLLVGYFVITLTRNPWREMLQKSQMQQMMLMILSIYLICWTPFSVLHYFSEYFTTKVFDYNFYKYVKYLHFSHTLAIVSLVYKPFLLYLMNHEFKTAVNQIIRRENNKFVTFENRMCSDDVAPIVHDFWVKFILFYINQLSLKCFIIITGQIGGRKSFACSLKIHES